MQECKYRIPDWCRDKCYNSTSIACEYECAGARDARYFVARPDLTLRDIAPFPTHDWTWDMSPQERQAVAGLYLEKLVEEITGIPQDPTDQRRKMLKMAAVTNEQAWKLLGEMAAGMAIEK